ncbi:hypothetical protein [Maridesulfovibrio hydrothermalis]|uniref:DUF4153 domain-containing protein n=1 Tax=Maridesulfovibrio hydrothermalis AM13 = DSM 14728 TaxID=1121451 RepID=L0RDP6_9BACT|nr:hypothetical protein [Maridesulfovibrio hydrothermalis]CCO24320.1 conserved membrane protein of unknown function [Maridesulfovibrio hydrothermalis AM13 = DSM 14728]
MTLRTKILNSIENPEELERIYRSDKESFKKSYKDILKDRPDSLLLQAWQARFEYGETIIRKLSSLDLVVMISLCLVAGSLLKIPDWSMSYENDFYPRFVALVPLSVMYLFKMHLRGWPGRLTMIGGGIICCSAIGISIIPEKWDDVFALACFNLPLLLWTLYGVSRLGADWKIASRRIEYIRFTGELIIHAGLLFIGGGILLLLTAGLLELLSVNSSWIIETMATYGLASIPLVAAWATDSYSAARKMVPLLARIFSPLLLVLILSYMAAMTLNIDDIFTDRSTLLIYNLLLLSVLATAVFTLTGRGQHAQNRLESITISLMIGATLMLDSLAICAIGWRIQEFGLTVNRLAVLGSNLAVFGNLAVMGWGYIKYWRGKGSLNDIESAIAAYLPVYVIWTFFSVFIQPWIFRY